MSSFSTCPLTNPLDFIDSHFHRIIADSSESEKSHFRSDDFNVSDIFEDFLKDVDFKSSIPHFSGDKRDKSLSLVRYVGLVQDVLDPEYYVGCYRQNKTTGNPGYVFTKYREHVEFEADDVINLPTRHEQIFDRMPVVCVPLPGENDWSRVKSQGIDTYGVDQRGPKGRKRTVDNATSIECQDDISSVYPNGSCLVKLYDQRSGDHSDHSRGVRMHDMIEVVGILCFPSRADGTCILATEAQSTNKRLKSRHDMIDICKEDCDSKMCEDDISTMHVVDCTSLLAGADDFMQDSLYEPFCDISDSHPAMTSSLPIIHCLVYRLLGPSFPLYSEVSSVGVLTSIEDASRGQRMVLERLTDSLFGDHVSAQYITLALLSKSYKPNRGAGVGHIQLEGDEDALGVLPVNLFNLQQGDIRIGRLLTTLREIVPRLIHLTVDIDSLNDTDFTLEKDNTTNSFSQSPLQLASGTVLVINECGLAQGKLSPVGVRNLKCLRNLIRYQTIEAQFGYFALKYPLNVSVLIVSDKPSLLSSESTVGIRCKALSDVNTVSILTSEQGRGTQNLELMRDWWGNCMLIDDVSMHESMLTVAEEAFVEMRHKRTDEEESSVVDVGKSGVPTVDDFQRMITTSRLCAVADGCSEISICHWERMLHIEQERSFRNI